MTSAEDVSHSVTRENSRSASQDSVATRVLLTLTIAKYTAHSRPSMRSVLSEGIPCAPIYLRRKIGEGSETLEFVPSEGISELSVCGCSFGRFRLDNNVLHRPSVAKGRGGRSDSGIAMQHILNGFRKNKHRIRLEGFVKFYIQRGSGLVVLEDGYV